MYQTVLLFLMAVLSIASCSDAIAEEKSTYASVNIIRVLLETPIERLNYGRAKLIIDKLIDPSIDVEGSLTEIDRMVSNVKRMLATIPAGEAKKSVERLRALKAFLYRKGHWNKNRPFQYDLKDPYGQKIATKLLPNYLKSRKGNCISMPILFLVLGERLDLKLSLSTTPLHVLVKYTDDQTGKIYNLEPTSGAGFTRDIWYQNKSPMTEAAIKNGVYLKHLSRKETLAVMAGLVVDHLIDQKRYKETIAVTEVLLEAYPQHAYLLAKKGTAYYHLLKAEVIDQYPKVHEIPAQIRKWANQLYRQNQTAFRQAEALGWRQTQLH